MSDSNKILSSEIFEWYPNRYPFKSFINSVANFVDINGIISVAGLFLPEFILYNNSIFLKEHVEEDIRKGIELYSNYGSGKKSIERENNLFNLDEFFLLAADEACEDLRLIRKFGELLEYFWGRKLKELYPDREFKFEISENMYDEDGLCITFWEE